MRKITLFLAIFCCMGQLIAQTKVPQFVNFQAVARDASGALITNTNIEVQLSVYDSNPTMGGGIVWCSTYGKTTNPYGSFSVRMNEGNPLSSVCNGSVLSFEEILWKDADMWLRIEFKHGVGSFILLGDIEFSSLAYAFTSDCSHHTDSAEYAMAVPFASTVGYSTTADNALFADSAVNSNFALTTIIASVADSVSEVSSLGANQGDFLLWNTTTQQWLPSDSIPGYWDALDLDGGKDTIGHEGSIVLQNGGNDLINLSATNNYGEAVFLGANGLTNAGAGGTNDDDGVITVNNGAGTIMSLLGISASQGNGSAIFYGPNGSMNIRLNALASDAGKGVAEFYDQGGLYKADIGVGSLFLGGEINLNGSNGDLNFRVTRRGSFGNFGEMCVYDVNGAPVACMEVDNTGSGLITGTTKAFHMLHPNDPNKMIWYAAVEGPEAAAYVRGTGKMVNGRAEVEFPDHFRTIIDETTLTIHLTPRSLDSKGIAAYEQDLNGFKVGELRQGTGTYEFAWEATAERKDQKYFQVIRDARDFYDTEEEHQNAIKSYSERYKKMGIKAVY